MFEVMILVSSKILPSWCKVHVANNKRESDSDSVSVNSAEPEDVEDFEQLANDISGESEDENYEFHGF